MGALRSGTGCGARRCGAPGDARSRGPPQAARGQGVSHRGQGLLLRAGREPARALSADLGERRRVRQLCDLADFHFRAPPRPALCPGCSRLMRRRLACCTYARSCAAAARAGGAGGAAAVHLMWCPCANAPCWYARGCAGCDAVAPRQAARAQLDHHTRGGRKLRGMGRLSRRAAADGGRVRAGADRGAPAGAAPARGGACA